MKAQTVEGGTGESTTFVILLVSAVAMGVVGVSIGLFGALGAGGASNQEPAGYVAPATCGPGSYPEDGVQGEVPKADRVSGRSQFGYQCNMTLVGKYNRKDFGVSFNAPLETGGVLVGDKITLEFDVSLIRS